MVDEDVIITKLEQVNQYTNEPTIQNHKKRRFHSDLYIALLLTTRSSVDGLVKS